MAHEKYMTIFNDREIATILAALRFYQKNISYMPEAIQLIATDGGALAPLNAAEIDALCEGKVNVSPVQWTRSTT